MPWGACALRALLVGPTGYGWCRPAALQRWRRRWRLRASAVIAAWALVGLLGPWEHRSPARADDGAVAPPAPAAAELVLRITADRPSVASGERLQLVVEITNRAKAPVMLPYPGDGSDYG